LGLKIIWSSGFCLTKYASECTGGQIKNFQNTFDEMGMEIQTKFLWNPDINVMSMTVARLHAPLECGRSWVPALIGSNERLKLVFVASICTQH
jgi:hypothetical protein